MKTTRIILSLKKLHGGGAEETTQFQGTIALVEDWGSVPRIHMVGHNHS